MLGDPGECERCRGGVELLLRKLGQFFDFSDLLLALRCLEFLNGLLEELRVYGEARVLRNAIVILAAKRVSRISLT